FMGCYAAVCALRTAHHIARSQPNARVLAVTVELCTLHLQDTQALEQLLAMLQFSDGAGAALITSEPGGFEMSHLFSLALEDSAELIQWNIGDTGFEMTLSGEVPARIQHALEKEEVRSVLHNGWGADEIDSWAVHAGGRSILDAVERGLPGRRLGCDRAGAGWGDAGADRAQPGRARPGLRRLPRLGRACGAAPARARRRRARCAPDRPAAAGLGTPDRRGGPAEGSGR